MANNKHLTLNDRIKLETMLSGRANFRFIASALDKDPSTISKEVRLHLVREKTGGFNKPYNACAHRQTCMITKRCSPCYASRNYRFCRSCSMCNGLCHDFVKQECLQLVKPPYVCNGCKRRPECTLEKAFYHAKDAQKIYEDLLKETRTGISFSQDEIRYYDALITPLVRKGQSLHHICVTNRDTIMLSERTLYRIIDDGLIGAKNIDLPRKVRFKTHRRKKVFKVDRACRIGRTFELFKAFINEHPDFPITQMDSVEGKKGGKVLLTIHFTSAQFMLAFLREHNDSRSVTAIFEGLFTTLGTENFCNLFKVLLTDNGSEFSNPAAIEFDANNIRRTRIYYCDPSAPYQKGSAERNHEFIRCFIPKGKSLEDYTQTDISLMMDHINSYCRESLSNKAPYEMFQFLYGKEILDLLQCSHIPPQEVTLNRSIFRKEPRHDL